MKLNQDGRMWLHQIEESTRQCIRQGSDQLGFRLGPSFTSSIMIIGDMLMWVASVSIFDVNGSHVGGHVT